MGDRANVYIHQDDEPGVYLYTHWTGTELPQTVRASLISPRGQARIDDIAYLTRIIFEDMLDGSFGTETGYGIATYAPDGDDRIVDINVSYKDRQTVATLIGYPYEWPDMPDDPYDYDEVW